MTPVISVDFEFTGAKPGFGDLFLICGERHPNFPPEGNVDFRPLSNLAVSQVDDYFGVQVVSNGGPPGDVAIWLFPLVAGNIVDHHSGPFDGLRLDYDTLRNPPHRLDHYLQMLRAFQSHLSGRLRHRSVNVQIAEIEAKAAAKMRHWQQRDLEPGSPQALAFDT